MIPLALIYEKSHTLSCDCSILYNDDSPIQLALKLYPATFEFFFDLVGVCISYQNSKHSVVTGLIVQMFLLLLGPALRVVRC